MVWDEYRDQCEVTCVNISKGNVKNMNTEANFGRNKGRIVQWKAMRLIDIDLSKLPLASSYLSFLEEGKRGCDASYRLKLSPSFQC